MKLLLHYFLHAEPTGVAAWQLADEPGQNDAPPTGRDKSQALSQDSAVAPYQGFLR